MEEDQWHGEGGVEFGCVMRRKSEVYIRGRERMAGEREREERIGERTWEEERGKRG